MMRVLLCLLLGFMLVSCQHHLVGQKVQPHHRLENSGKYKVDGGWVAIKYDYVLKGDFMTIDGTVSFANAGDKFDNAHGVQMLLTFFFLDDENVVLQAESEILRKGGGKVEDESFHFTYPYKPEYKAVSLKFMVKGVTD